MHRRRSVHSITAAPKPLAQDISARTSRYLMSMTFRTACFVAAFFVAGWLRWGLIAGAVALPYIAVVIANAGRERTPGPDELLAHPELAPGQSPELPTPDEGMADGS